MSASSPAPPAAAAATAAVNPDVLNAEHAQRLAEKAQDAATSPEQIITMAILCKRAMKKLQSEYAESVRPHYQKKQELQRSLLEYMQLHNLEAIEVPGSAAQTSGVQYLRRCQRVTTSAALSAKMVLSTLAALSADKASAVCASVAENCAKAYDAWRTKLAVKERKALAAEMKGSSTAEIERAVAMRVASAAPPPCAETVLRSCGGRKLPTRAPVASTKSPDAFTLASEALYQCLYTRHKPLAQRVVVEAKPARSGTLPVSRLPEAVAGLVTTFYGAAERSRTAAAAIAQKRKRVAGLLRMCEPRIKPYIESVDPESHCVRRVMNIGGDAVAFNVSCKRKRKWSKALCMYDVSQIVNACVRNALLHFPVAGTAGPQDVAKWLARDDVRAIIAQFFEHSLQSLEKERVEETSRLVIRHMRPRGSGFATMGAAGAGAGVGAYASASDSESENGADDAQTDASEEDF